MKTSDFEKAYNLLKNYCGDNNLIKYLKYKVDNNIYSLTEFDAKYILENSDYKTVYCNKIVKISSDYGEILKEKLELDFTPEKLKITKVIGEFGGSYHCYVQYRRSVAPSLMWVKKRYLLTRLIDNSIIKIDIDFDKYDKLTEEYGRKVKELQKEGIKYLLRNKQCILADGMGCGKTSESIIAAMETGAKKILIICPASLKSTWKREICYYNKPEDVTIINSNKWSGDTRFTIINYDILHNFYEVATEDAYEEKEIEEGVIIKVPIIKKNSTGKFVTKKAKSRKKDLVLDKLSNSELFKQNFDCVIIDEAHKLSNNTSIRYKTIEDFLSKSKPQYIFLLTGTPLTNQPINLYHVLKLINADVTYDYQYFVMRYCGGRKIKLKTGKEVLIPGKATNLNELKEKISYVYIRRLLTEMTDMVEKNVETRYYDLSPQQMTIYNKLWKEYIDAQTELGNDESENYRQLVEGILVRQYLAKEMIANTIQLVDEKIEDNEKVIIICTFTEEIEALKEYYGEMCVVYDGKMTLKQKDKAEYEFMNNPKVKVFIGQIIACSVGLTLTVAHTMVFNSYSWVAADNAQAEDRIYRLNQNKDVTCIYQLFNDSVSQHMFEKVLSKKKIMDSTITSEKNKK